MTIEIMVLPILGFVFGFFGQVAGIVGFLLNFSEEYHNQTKKKALVWLSIAIVSGYVMWVISIPIMFNMEWII